MDDTGDIYDHTSQFFNSKPEVDDGVELNERKFRPNIADLMDDLDQKVYSAKRVSREQRQK